MSTTPAVIRRRLLARARFRHWVGFERVARLGSVRKAAEEIGLAQPALTVLLADLEAMLGAPLFERHARGMRLTPLGRALLPTARRVLGAVDDTAERAAALQARAQAVVRICAIGGAVSGLLASALPALATRHPELLVQLAEADPLEVDQMVARGDVDVALCRAPRVVPDGWRFEPLLPDRFAVVAAAGHPLAGRRRVGLARLRRETWLALPAGSAASEAFEALFGDGDPPPSCGVSSRSPSILWAMLASRPLLALVPASLARQLVEAGALVELPLERPLPFEPIGALVPGGEPQDSVAHLLEALQAAAGRD